MPNERSTDLPLISSSLYENLDFRQSLMERAERGEPLLQQVAREAVRHTAEVAISSAAQQEADLALKQAQHKLHERERALAQRTRLHAEFDLESLGDAIDGIRNLTDPVEQTGRINRLRSQYAPFRADPVLARTIDTQLATLMPIVEENRVARVQERIAANRYARSPEEAAGRFPGYLIRTELLPTGQNERGETQFSPIYLAEDKADPRLEAEAFQQLRLTLARVAASQPTETRRALEDLAKHPAVAAVLGVPGSHFAEAYLQSWNPGSKNRTEVQAMIDTANAGRGRLAAVDEVGRTDYALATAKRVYGEIGSLRPTQVEGRGDPNSLLTAMRQIAGIAFETPTRVSRPREPNLRDPIAKNIFTDIQGSVDDRTPPGKEKHFVIWPSNDGGKTPAPGIPAKWPYTEKSKITTVYGPFRTVSPRGAREQYIFFYTGVE